MVLGEEAQRNTICHLSQKCQHWHTDHKAHGATYLLRDRTTVGNGVCSVSSLLGTDAGGLVHSGEGCIRAIAPWNLASSFLGCIIMQAVRELMAAAPSYWVSHNHFTQGVDKSRFSLT